VHPQNKRHLFPSRGLRRLGFTKQLVLTTISAPSSASLKCFRAEKYVYFCLVHEYNIQLLANILV